MSANPAATGGRWRSVAFIVVICLLLLGWLEGPLFVVGLLSPWLHLLPRKATASFNLEIHDWHFIHIWALSAILVGGSLLALLRRPERKPVLVQFVILAAAGVMAAVIPVAGFAPPFAIYIIGSVLLVALYPSRRELVRFSREPRVSLPLVILSGLLTAALAFDVWRTVPFAGWPPWAVVATLCTNVALVVAAWLTVSKRPAWDTLGVLTGVALVYLGLAAIQLPRQEGSWGALGGGLSVLAGVAFVAATLIAMRSDKRAGVSLADSTRSG